MPKEIDYGYNLREYWGYLKKYKALFLLLLLVVFLNQAGAIMDKFLFKIIIDNGTAFSAGNLLKNEFIQILLVITLVYVITIILRFALQWLHTHLINILDAKLILDLKNKYFSHIMKLSYDFHTTHRTGSLISRLLRGGRAMEQMTDTLIFNFAPLLFQTIAVCISLWYFSLIPAIIVFCTVLAFVIYSYIIQQKQRQATLAVNEAEDLEKAQVSDYFMNIDTIKYFGKEENVFQRFRKIAEQTKIALIRNWHFYRWMNAGHSVILNIGTFLVILFPLLDFLNGRISIGTLTFIYTAYTNIFTPLFSFDALVRLYYQSMADFESLFQYGKIKNEVKDQPGATPLKIKKGVIEYKDINFSYRQRNILSHFNLKIPAGKRIALVGPSGSGKTTLVKLLYRMYDVQGGKITLDGKDIHQVQQESLRSEMSLVPQECLLFDDTIYHNIAFSNPTASKEEVMEAIRLAQLNKIIQQFPKKEHTIVGERGVRLSGGEKQRVSIARALLANKKILVLDEATSALDSRTEREIQQSLEKLMKHRTSIIIAHRLSTIMNADAIVVMDKGKIVQMGKHSELIRQPGMYKKLWNLQKGGYIK